MKLDFQASKPIYQQIIDEIRKAIARGELSPGDRLPSQRDLAETARVNQNTVQRAYRELEMLKLVETLRGQGTFVTNSPATLRNIQQEMAKQALQRFIREMYSLGFSDGEIINMVAEQCKKASLQSASDKERGDTV